MRPEEQHRVAAEKRGENSRPVHALWRWGLRREGQTGSPSLTLWGPRGRHSCTGTHDSPGRARKRMQHCSSRSRASQGCRAVVALAPGFQCALMTARRDASRGRRITAMGFGSAPLRCAASRRGGGGGRRRRRGKASKILTVFVSRDRSGSRGEIRVLQKRIKLSYWRAVPVVAFSAFYREEMRPKTSASSVPRPKMKNPRHARSCTGCAMN